MSDTSEAEIADMPRDEIERTINDPSTTRKHLESIAMYRFQVPRGSMRKFSNRNMLIEKISTLLRNERTHSTIEAVARKRSITYRRSGVRITIYDAGLDVRLEARMPTLLRQPIGSFDTLYTAYLDACERHDAVPKDKAKLLKLFAESRGWAIFFAPRKKEALGGGGGRNDD